MDALIVVGLTMTATIAACSLAAYNRLVVAFEETEQQAFDRHFAEIVAHFDD